MPKISDEQRAAARQKLIDATVAVAERDGVEGLTTRAIVAEAGTSAGMFYGHFSSKEELLAAVVESKTDELTSLVEAELSLGSSLEDVLRSLVTELVTSPKVRALAAFRATSGSDEAVAAQRAINARIVEAFRPLVVAGCEAGLIRPDVDVEATVEFIDVAIDGVNRRRILEGFVSSDERVCAVVLAAVEAHLLHPSTSDHTGA